MIRAMELTVIMAWLACIALVAFSLATNNAVASDSPHPASISADVKCENKIGKRWEVREYSYRGRTRRL